MTESENNIHAVTCRKLQFQVTQLFLKLVNMSVELYHAVAIVFDAEDGKEGRKNGGDSSTSTLPSTESHDTPSALQAAPLDSSDAHRSETAVTHTQYVTVVVTDPSNSQQLMELDKCGGQVQTPVDESHVSANRKASDTTPSKGKISNTLTKLTLVNSPIKDTLSVVFYGVLAFLGPTYFQKRLCVCTCIFPVFPPSDVSDEDNILPEPHLGDDPRSGGLSPQSRFTASLKSLGRGSKVAVVTETGMSSNMNCISDDVNTST